MGTITGKKPPLWEGVPKSLKRDQRWGVTTPKPGKLRKAPHRRHPKSGNLVATGCLSQKEWMSGRDAKNLLRDNPDAWTAGFFLRPGECCVDIDNGNDALARELMAAGMVTEESVGGGGFHCTGLVSEKPVLWTKRDGIEVFAPRANAEGKITGGRFIITTGRLLDGSPRELAMVDHRKVAEILYKHTSGEEEREDKQTPGDEDPGPEPYALQPKPGTTECASRPPAKAPSRDAPKPGTIAVETVKHWLTFINADPYPAWLTVGMAMHSWGHPEAYALWCHWSASSSKYDEKDQLATWRSFKRGGGITIRSVRYLAQRGEMPIGTDATKETFSYKEVSERIEARWPRQFLWSSIGIRYVWTGAIFAEDTLNVGFERAVAVVEEYRERADKLQDRAESMPRQNEDGLANHDRNDLERAAKAMRNLHARYASKRGYSSILDTLDTSREVRCKETDLDKDAYLIATPGGVLDLRSNTWLAPDPARKITRSTAVPPGDPDPEADAEWEGYLTAFLPDPAEREFFRQFIGFGFTGYCVEKRALILVGKGDSGKSSILNAILNAAGDYGTGFSWAAFLPARGSGHEDRLASMRGRRIGVAHEVPPKTIDTERWKKWTAGDPDQVSAKGDKSFTMKPAVTFLASANQPPSIPPGDKEAWERLLLLNVTGKFSRSGVADAMLTDRIAAAIVRWALEGAVDWFKRWGKGKPIAIPPTVRNAVRSAHLAQNPCALWAEECCTFDPDSWASSTLLRTHFQEWSDTSVSEKRFGDAMRLLGLDQRSRVDPADGKQKRGWLGLEIRGNDGSKRINTGRPALENRPSQGQEGPQ